MTKNNLPVKSEFLLYTSLDGKVRVNVLFGEETVWLTQKQMAELFQKSIPTINEHIQNYKMPIRKESWVRNQLLGNS